MRRLYWIEFGHVGVSSIEPRLGNIEKFTSEFVPGASPQDATNNLLIRYRNHDTINVHTIAVRRVEEVTLENCERFDLDPAYFDVERNIARDVS